MATTRQLNLLNFIVEIYVRSGEPVSSGVLLENNPDIKLSSATIRNEMFELEKSGYILKSNSYSSRTSGRVPTKKGYKHYLQNIKTNPDSIISIKTKLDQILQSRKNNIDLILKEAMELINELTNTLTLSKEIVPEMLLETINCYPLGKDRAIIIIIANNGQVTNKDIPLNGYSYNEFEKAIKIFSKRLNGIKISNLCENLQPLTEILSFHVQGMEDKFQEIIKLMFFNILSTKVNYYGMNSLVTSNNLDIKTQVKKIFTMIENNSIWDLLETNDTISTDTKGITVDMDVMKGVSVVKKSFNLGCKNQQITILGSNNQNYEKLFTMLEYLEKIIEGEIDE